MVEPAASLQAQQLLELLAIVTSLPDEASAVHSAVERAAQALEAEVAAVVLDGRVVAAVGFPTGAAPNGELVAVGCGQQDWLDVPGLGKCPTIATAWEGNFPGQLVIARWGDEPFSVEERNLVRGMARVLELTLAMLRTHEAEHLLREQSERRAAENARLLDSVREQQQVLEHLSSIQRAIARRDPLSRILETITTALQELLGDDIVGLWVRDEEIPGRAKLVSSVGLAASSLPGMPLNEAGAVGEAMRRDDVVVLHGYEHASPAIQELTHGRLCASMAAPVHESGEVTGGLLVASYRADRAYTAAAARTLATFAQNVSLALTDAHTFSRMNKAVHDTLTGLASRGLFLEKMAERLAESDLAALLFIDLDRFKRVNDALGHAAGDELLTITADRIRAQVRPTDVAGRLGGDEFALLLGDVTDVDEVVRLADQIVRALGVSMLVAGRQLRVNASIGIALSSLGSPGATDLMRRADIAMYQAKRSGRGRYEIFTDDMLRGYSEGPL